MGLPYTGSLVLKPFADKYGIDIYQLNFLFLEFLALVLGVVLRRVLQATTQNTFKRHLYNVVMGLALGYFCYGSQLLHVFFQSFGCYLIMAFCPRKYSHFAVFVFAMGYVSCLHLYGQLMYYYLITLDITYPLMISTQKLTALAFSFYDGSISEDELNSDQKYHRVKKLPSLLEFTSYMFNFQGIIVGPLVFYNDYIEFINGQSIRKHKAIQESKKLPSNPNPLEPVVTKMLAASLMGVIFFLFENSFPLSYNLSEELWQGPIYYRIFYLYVSLLMRRVKYYLAWVLADAVNNASGLGFNGYDSKGHAKWDLVTNVNIIKLETSTSFKTFLDNWNIQTQFWLRRMAYDRLPKGKTLAVFVLSAFWHGFYPGYYLSFVLGAFIVYAGRGIRRKIRPFFQKNQATIYLYAAISWACTLFAVSYAAGPYELRSLEDGIAFFNRWYWSINLITVVIILILPVSSSKKKKETSSK